MWHELVEMVGLPVSYMKPRYFPKHDLAVTK